MTIEKGWFFEHGLRQGLDVKTITNALDPRFLAIAKRYCNEEEEAYVDRCVEFQQKQLEALRCLQQETE